MPSICVKFTNFFLWLNIPCGNVELHPQVTGEGVAEHLLEMRTILEEQKRRLEIKIRYLQDESHASDDPSHNAATSNRGGDQSLQEVSPASSNDVPAEDLRPSTQETPEAGSSGVRDVRSNVATRTDEPQKNLALPVETTTATVATADVAATDSPQMVPVSFEQSVAMESPHASTAQSRATVASATASASLRFLGPPPAVSVGIDPAQLQAPLAAAHVSGAPFHVSAAFQHAMQSVTPTLAQDGAQHQAVLNGVWLGQTAAAHGTMVPPGNSVGNQCFLFRGNGWRAPSSTISSASATAGGVPVGSSVEFAPPSADAGSMSASTLFHPSLPLTPSSWPQAVSSSPSVVSLPPPPPLPAGVEAAVAGITTESGCTEGERQANSGEIPEHGVLEGESTEAQAKTVTSMPAAAGETVWQQYHDGVTREPVVRTSIVNGKRNGTHESIVTDCVRGRRAFAFSEEEGEESGGAARCLPMLWRPARGRAGVVGGNGEHVDNSVVRDGGNIDGDSNGTTELGCSSGSAGGVNGDVKGVEGMAPAGTPADDGHTSSEASACIPAPSRCEDSQVEERVEKTVVSALKGVEKAGCIREVNFSTDSDKCASNVSQEEDEDSPMMRTVHAADVGSVMGGGEGFNGGRVDGDTDSCGDGGGVGGRAEERRTVVRVGGDHKLNIGTPAMLSFR